MNCKWKNSVQLSNGREIFVFSVIMQDVTIWAEFNQKMRTYQTHLNGN